MSIYFRQRISTKPGNFRGLGTDKSGVTKNYNGTPPPSTGLPAPKIIAKTLGIKTGMPIHQAMAEKLMNHPDTDVAAAAKKLMRKY